MMRKTIIFLSGILLAIVSVGSSPPSQQVQFNLTLDTRTMPAVKVDLSSTYLNIGQLTLNNDRLPVFTSQEIKGQVSLAHSNRLDVSLTCHNQDDSGACALVPADNKEGKCPACKIKYQVCLAIDRNMDPCSDHLANQTIRVNSSTSFGESTMPFTVYVKGSGGDLIKLGSNSEKYVGSFSLTFRASFFNT
ncbi:hypothetical protein [Cysteiniphilum sp. 6C5]|uniref:hypothetical protein n=1 Tax=unclassified Cysteiniphilum TaxID=2610889 RepID=UPI003F87191D